MSHHDHSRHHHIENIKLAAILNISFTIIEIIGGVLTNSLAVIADAFHDLGDSLVLISAWKIEKISLKKPDWKRTFGYRRLSLLSAFLSAIVIFGGTIVILFQAAGRLLSPQAVNAKGMIIIAIIGITANAIGSWRLGHGKTANERVLSWHLLEDVLGWVGILISATVIQFTGFYILDPIITIGFSLFIVWGVWRNSRELFNIFLEGTPRNISLPSLMQELEGVKGMRHIYDIHLWSLDGKHNYFSMKAVVDDKIDNEAVKSKIKKILDKNHITHDTIELDSIETHFHKEKEQEFLN